MIRRKHTGTSRSGTVTVEFALTMPVALMLTFGLVEFARVNMIRNTAQNAAYEGARAAIIPGGTAARAEARANLVMSTISTRNVDVTIDPPTITDTTPKVTVTISVPLGENMWITPRYFVNQAMVRTCELTRESTNSGF